MKKLILGLVIGLTIGMTTSAFAAVGDKVTAVFAEFSYMVNGEQQVLDAPVLVHDGNSYLRTTQISNMLGYDVTYKADTRTIEFNNPQPITAPTESPGPVVTPVPSGDPTTPPEYPTATPEPTASPTPTVTPEPSPTPNNLAACQAIRDNWTVKIYSYIGKNPKEQEYTRNLMASQRDAELSAAGC